VLQFGFGTVASPSLTSNIFTNTTDFQFNAGAGANIAFVVGATEAARFAPTTGNLLIGTTTDITGTGGLHVAGTGTASTTTSGALRVGSNVGLSGNAGGASYFGGNVSLTNATPYVLFPSPGWSGTAQAYFGPNLNAGTSSTGDYFAFNVPTGKGYSLAINAVSAFSIVSGAATFAGTVTTGGIAGIGVTPSTGLGLNVNLDPGTLAYGAANAWLGARIRPARAGTTGNAFAVSGQLEVTSGTQTSGATFMSEAPAGTITNHTYFFANSSGLRVAPTGNYSFYAESAAGPAFIGSTTPSTGVGTGALQVAGGIYAGAASVFGSTLKINGTGSADSPLHVYESAAAGTGNGITVEQAGAGDAAIQFLLTGVQRWSAGIDNSDSDSFVIGTGALGSSNVLKLATTGAATFAGAVTGASTIQVGTVLRVGGATASFPGLRNTGAQLDVVTASNSAWADIAAAQFKQSDNGISWSSGTGSPEGVKTAPVGSLYSRTDGAASTTLYVKQSGTGNTGWVAK
jgi:hypothetical protein